MYETRAELLAHYSTHPSRRVECPNCHKMFKARGLSAHLAIEANPDHPFNKNRAQLFTRGLFDEETAEPDGGGADEEDDYSAPVPARDDPAQDADDQEMVDSATQTPVNGVGAPAAPSIGLHFPGEEADTPGVKRDGPVTAKAPTGGMMRVRGTIKHRTPSLVISNEAMALFEYATSLWPDKYGKATDFAEDLSTFVDDCIVSLFKLYGIGPVIYRSQTVLVGGTNGHANHG